MIDLLSRNTDQFLLCNNGFPVSSDCRVLLFFFIHTYMYVAILPPCKRAASLTGFFATVYRLQLLQIGATYIVGTSHTMYLCRSGVPVFDRRLL